MSDIDDIFKSDEDDQADLTPILIVDDNPSILEALKLTLDGVFRLVGSSSLETALDALTPDIPLVLLDIQMAGNDGLECFEKIRAKRPDIKIIFHTAYAGSSEKARAAENLDHDGILNKGEYSSEGLTATLKAALNDS